MGIEDFSTFLDRNTTCVYFSVPLTSLSGKRIAVDMDNLLYIMISTSAKIVLARTNLADREPDQNELQRITLDRVLERLTTFMFYNIQVVCCFDTKPNPLKERVRRKRQASREKKEIEYEQAKAALYGVDPLFRNSQLTARFAKAYQYSVRPSFEFVAYVQNFLTSLGFPVLRAGDLLGPITGDAEALAASLCLNGLCFAGATTDSDFHTYGGNIAITEISTKSITTTTPEGMIVHQSVHHATLRSLETILQQSQLSFESFRDVCIMLGNDYNLRVPQVGPVKVMELIRKYGSIPGGAWERDPEGVFYNYAEVIPIWNSSLVRLNLTDRELNFDANKFQAQGRLVLEGDQLLKYLKIINDLPAQFIGSAPIEIPILTQSFGKPIEL